MFSPPFLRAFNNFICLIPSKSTGSILELREPSIFLFRIIQLVLHLLQTNFFSSYLDLRFFQPVVVKFPKGLFPASISPLQISMKCLVLASHQSALSAILQSSKRMNHTTICINIPDSKLFVSFNSVQAFICNVYCLIDVAN